MNYQSQLVVTVGRQLGSGGKEIGQILAKALNLSFYDREILALAAKESGFKEEHFEKNDEKVSSSWFEPFGGFSDKELFRCQSETIRKIAEKENSLFIGRCADYILREHQHCINIFICAPLEWRTERLASKQQISIKEAREIIQKTDKNRASYYDFYTGKEWGAASSYHICVDSSLLGIDKTAERLRDFIL